MKFLKFGEKYSKAFKEFIKKYEKENCEGKPFQITVLSGFNVKGAGKSKDYDFYCQHINCLASINKGKVADGALKFLYFIDNGQSSSFLDIENLTPYDFIVRKIKNKEEYLVIKLKGKSETTLFNSIIEEQSKPLIIKSGSDVFEFHKTYEDYEGKVVIDNKKINVSLYPKSNTTDATESLNTYNKIKNDFKNFYNTILSQCSKNMVSMANEWREEGDTHEITADEIFKRIDSDSFDLEVRNTKYTIYLDDGDLFFGHTIMYKGNIDNEEFSTTIAG